MFADKFLVCEGRCGAPWTARYDAQVLSDKAKGRPLDRVMEAARRLVHTRHSDLGRRGVNGRMLYACLDCGTLRVFGWGDAGVPPEFVEAPLVPAGVAHAILPETPAVGE